MKVVPITNEETIVKRSRLADLERKEQAHDAYLRAVMKMRDRRMGVSARAQDTAAGPREWSNGWLAALREFAEEVARA